MYGTTLFCSSEDCCAAFDVFSEESQHGVWTCQFCRSELFDIGHPPQSPEPDGLIIVEPTVRVIQGPWSSGRMMDVQLSRFLPKAGDYFEGAVADGIPLEIRERHDRGVLLRLDDLAALVEAVPFEIVARHSSTDHWTCYFDELGISHTDQELDAALIGLAVAVRRRVRKLFRGDPGERAERLPLLLRLWMADAQGRLGKVLEEATTFETSYEERLEQDTNRPV